MTQHVGNINIPRIMCEAGTNRCRYKLLQNVYNNTTEMGTDTRKLQTILAHMLVQ